MKLILKITFLAFLGMGMKAKAQNEYFVIQPTKKINNSPWYGLGRSNVTMPNANYAAVQLAGYYGLLFKTAGGEFVLHQNGNVGVGTTAPNATLQIWDSKHTGGPEKEIEQKRLSIAPVTHSGSDWFFTTRDNSPYANLDIGYGSNKTLTLRHDGNIGIRNRSPEVKLDILTRPSSYESFIKLQTKDAPDDFFMINNATGTNGQFIPNLIGRHTSDNRAALYLSGWIKEGNDQGDKPIMTFDSRIEGKPAVNRPLFGWDSHGQRRMTLLANGDLGIGTANTKGFKLGVKGKIAAEEVKVATFSNWSDFVFYEDYDLPTLTEVENHIKEKGHLKDIPSAEEVAKDGFYLGAMDAKLLQKIEELTLYTIGQQKEIEQLKKENTEIKQLNQKLLEVYKRLEKLENQ